MDIEGRGSTHCINYIRVLALLCIVLYMFGYYAELLGQKLRTEHNYIFFVVIGHETGLFTTYSGPWFLY